MYWKSVDVEAILTRRVIAPMKTTVAELHNLVKDEWVPSGRVPEIDWSRVRTLEFQETLARRESLAAKLGSQSQWQCLSCEDFKHHVRHFFLLTSIFVDFCLRRLAHSSQ